MKDLKKKTDADLAKLIQEKREELRVFRFGEAGSRSRNVRAGRNARRVIAQALTELKLRTLAGEEKTA